MLKTVLTVAALAVFGAWLYSALGKADARTASVDACVVSHLDGLADQSERLEYVRQFTRVCMREAGL